MDINSTSRTVTILASFLCFISTGHADEPRFEIGLRGNLLLGNGVPANDIMGFGVIGRYYLSNGWFAAATLDTYEFDFERPAEIVGIPQDPNVKAIDATTTSTVFGGHLGRQYGNNDHGFDWFWTAGIGVGFPDVGDASGPTAGGGTFDVATDAGTEIHLMATLGTSYHFTPSWSLSFAARLEHHFMDYQVTDTVSGATGSVDSQTPVGAYLSLNYGF